MHINKTSTPYTVKLKNQIIFIFRIYRNTLRVQAIYYRNWIINKMFEYTIKVWRNESTSKTIQYTVQSDNHCHSTWCWYIMVSGRKNYRHQHTIEIPRWDHQTFQSQEAKWLLHIQLELPISKTSGSSNF